MMKVIIMNAIISGYVNDNRSLVAKNHADRWYLCPVVNCMKKIGDASN